MRKKRASLPVTLLLMAAIIAGCGTVDGRPSDRRDGTDAQYVSIARQAPEAQAFLSRFPDAEILVDRSAEPAVDFRVTTHAPRSTTELWEGIRLRVFIDPVTGKPVRSLVQCNDEFVHTEIVSYLEQYAALGSCP